MYQLAFEITDRLAQAGAWQLVAGLGVFAVGVWFTVRTVVRHLAVLFRGWPRAEVLKAKDSNSARQRALDDDNWKGE